MLEDVDGSDVSGYSDDVPVFGDEFAVLVGEGLLLEDIAVFVHMGDTAVCSYDAPAFSLYPYDGCHDRGSDRFIRARCLTLIGEQDCSSQTCRWSWSGSQSWS